MTMQCAQTAILDNKVAIFSKSYCPYCKKAKALFKDEFPDVETTVYELDERDDGSEIQAYLLEKTGQRTVPNIFVNGQHIGGNDDLRKSFDAGNLTKLVRA
ncbi:hypothetical protein C0992_001316 [Termitomyces sp. T32_za158]|nr:hypothetical protein C0992_001316 [Termitomyces sp. T32_za158]